MEANNEVRFQLVKEVPYEGPTIAIDLGTSYAYVAVADNGKALILTHENGQKAFPCFISFTDSDRLIGSEAKVLAASNPQNTVYDFKRMVGKSFSDPILQADMKKWPFKVEADSLNRPIVVVTYKGETKKFHPEELTAMILVRLKEAAEKQLATPVKKAVITVPAYFRDGQRQATMDAANLAGLTVSRLINEPAAAAVAYGLSTQFPKGQVKILVYELGAGTFDVSVISVEDGFIQILSTVGDTHLGAEDFDNKMVEICAQEFKKTTGIELHNNWAALQKLKIECSKIRRALTKADEVYFKIEDLIDKKPFEYRIPKAEWSKMCEPILNKTVTLVKRVLQDTHIHEKDINQVILAGGGTRLPVVINLVKSIFPGHQPVNSIDTDQVVVMGAALLAQDIAGDSKEKKDLLLINVLPMSLGIEGPQGSMIVLMPRDTSIPIILKHTFTTAEENQEMILVTIYEGENKYVKDNHILGTFKLAGIPAAPKGSPAIQVIIHVDADGILRLKAVDKDNAKEIDTPVLKWTLSKGEVEKLKEGGFYYEETRLPKKHSKMDEVD